MPAGSDTNALIDWLYPDLIAHVGTTDGGDWFGSQCILGTLNWRVEFLNDLIGRRFPGDTEWECTSPDLMNDEHFDHLGHVGLESNDVLREARRVHGVDNFRRHHVAATARASRW
eukprot:1195543-Prorocentrum_minimum.AAC.5